MWNVPNVGLASLHLASFSRLICNPLPKDSTLPNIRTEKNSDRSHPNFSSSNPFVPSKRRTYRLTNYPIEFICIKRDTRLYHAPLCKFILIFVTRHRPFPFSPSPSSPLSSTRFLDHAHKSPETFCCTLWRERERKGGIEFLRLLLKSRQRGEKNAGRSGGGSVKMQVFSIEHGAGSIERNGTKGHSGGWNYDVERDTKFCGGGVIQSVAAHHYEGIFNRRKNSFDRGEKRPPRCIMERGRVAFNFDKGARWNFYETLRGEKYKYLEGIIFFHRKTFASPRVLNIWRRREFKFIICIRPAIIDERLKLKLQYL